MIKAIQNKQGEKMMVSEWMFRIASDCGWDSGIADENLAQALEKARADDNYHFDQSVCSSLESGSIIDFCRGGNNWNPMVDGGKNKEGLLEHYSEKEPTKFLQFDAWTENRQFDSVIRPDPKPGVAVTSSTTTELMTGHYSLRVLITAGISRKSALRALKEIFEFIKEESEGDLYLNRFLEDSKQGSPF